MFFFFWIKELDIFKNVSAKVTSERKSVSFAEVLCTNKIGLFFLQKKKAYPEKKELKTLNLKIGEKKYQQCGFGQPNLFIHPK